MNDYTHKRYLVKNKYTGETKTVVQKVGTRRYRPVLTEGDEIVSCIGGFRNPTIEPCMFVDEMGANMAHYSKEA